MEVFEASQPQDRSRIRCIAAVDGDSAYVLLHGSFGKSDGLRVLEVLALHAALPHLSVDLAGATLLDESILVIFRRVAEKRWERGLARLRMLNVPQHLRPLFVVHDLEELLNLAERRPRALRRLPE